MSVNKVVIQRRRSGMTVAFCRSLIEEMDKGERVFVAVSDEKDFDRTLWTLAYLHYPIEYEPIITPAQTRFIVQDELDTLYAPRVPSFRIIPEQLHGYMIWKKK